MTDALILLMSVTVGLFILKSLGGEGLNIRFQLAPISTPKGKKDHIIVWGALSIMLMGIANYFIRQSDADIISLLIIPLILGAVIGVLPSYKK